MSDTDDTFNFLISMCYTQLFNLLCEKADDVYGGRLPVHVASPTTIHAKQVCNNKKVTDHHAIVPTVSAGKTDLMSLPLGEREVLKLAAKGLLRAISECQRLYGVLRQAR